ncbi:hypothetical protein Trydic_g6191 [Trypoxylus dichotomus]
MNKENIVCVPEEGGSSIDLDYKTIAVRYGKSRETRNFLVEDFDAPEIDVTDLNDRRTTSILLLMKTFNLRQLKDIPNLNGKLAAPVLTELDVEFTVRHDLAVFVNED